jgi:DNA replication factor Dna2
MESIIDKDEAYPHDEVGAPAPLQRRVSIVMPHRTETRGGGRGGQHIATSATATPISAAGGGGYGDDAYDGECMTQDCVEWDESRHNLDPRKLADPTFQTPRSVGDDTPPPPPKNASPGGSSNRWCASSSSSTHKELQLRGFGGDDADAAAALEIDGIFSRLDAGDEDHGAGGVGGDYHRACSETPRRRGSSSIAITNMEDNDPYRTEIVVPGRRKRQRAAAAAATAAAAAERHHARIRMPLADRKIAARTQPDALAAASAAATIATASIKSPVPHGSTDFDDLLHQVETPPGDRTVSTMHGKIPHQPRDIGSIPTDKENAPNTVNVSASTSGDFLNEQSPAVTTSGQTPSFNNTDNEDDEFDDLDLSYDDLAKMDSLIEQVVSSQRQSSPPREHNTTPQEKNNAPMPFTENHSAAAVVTLAGKMSTAADNEFGDLPDLDFTTLDEKVMNTCTLGLSSTPVVAVNAPPGSNTVTDPFDDEFDDIDLDELVKKADAASTHLCSKEAADTQHTFTSNPIEASSVQTTNNFDDDDGMFDDLDLDALDRSILEKQAGTSAPCVSVPPGNVPVQNPRATIKNEIDGAFYLTFSRYRILRVMDDAETFTRTLTVANWTTSMLDEEDKLASALHNHSHHHLHDPNRTWPDAGLIYLRGEWYHTPVNDGDTIHICSLAGQFRTDFLPLMLHTCPPQGSDMDDLVMIVHPDLLLTPTVISDTISCTRRAVLKNRLGSTGLSCTLSLFLFLSLLIFIRLLTLFAHLCFVHSHARSFRNNATHSFRGNNETQRFYCVHSVCIN